MISHEMPNVMYLIGNVRALRILLSKELIIQNPNPNAQKMINVSW